MDLRGAGLCLPNAVCPSVALGKLPLDQIPAEVQRSPLCRFLVCADEYREVPMGGKAGSPGRCALPLLLTIGDSRNYTTTFL